MEKAELSLTREMDSPVLDVRLSAGVVEGRGTSIPECFCGQRHNILFSHLDWLELRLDTVLPFVPHNLPDPRLAQSFPLRPKATFTHGLKGLVDEDPAT